jgi:hypothetical protein
MTHSLEGLTPEIMASVVLDYMTLSDSADKTPGSQKEETNLFIELQQSVPGLVHFILFYADFLEKQDPEISVDDKVRLMFQTAFFMGWHARRMAESHPTKH